MISIRYQSTDALKLRTDGDGSLVATPLSIFLGERIAKHFSSKREFVRMSQPDGNENSVAGYLSQVLTGKKPASPELIQAWTKSLQLESDDVALLRFIAALTYVPEEWHADMVSLFNRDRASRGLSPVAFEHKRVLAASRQRRVHRKVRPG